MPWHGPSQLVGVFHTSTTAAQEFPPKRMGLKTLLKAAQCSVFLAEVSFRGQSSEAECRVTLACTCPCSAY